MVSSRRHRSPLLDPALLRIRPFAVGNTATIIAGMGFYAYLLTNILWLQYVWGYSVLLSGLAVVPGALVAAVLAAVLGPIAQKRGYRLVIVPGAIVWALAYVWYLTRVEVTPDFLGAWLPGQIISGIGVGATLPVLGSAALAAVPGGRFATASAVNSSARQIGAVLGIAILVAIVGTPTPDTVVDSLRVGWVFTAGCFVVTAVIAVFLGRVSETVVEPVDDDSVRPPTVSTREPARAVEPGSSALAAAPLLARLPQDVRDRLEARSEQVTVAAGELVFAAGDEASDMYVVTAGLLDVEVQGETVRQVGAGAVLGELALLTGGRRSASIRARRDSHLLRVTHETFEEVVGTDASALRALTGVLATQLQEASPPASTTTPRPTLVAVVALHPGAPAADVAAELTEQLGRHLTVVAPGRVGPDGLERAEQDADRVVLVADDSSDEWWSVCVRQADLLVVVASSDADPSAITSLGRTGSDLVLVGPATTSDRLRAFHSLLAPWQITQVAGALGTGLRPLAARIAGPVRRDRARRRRRTGVRPPRRARGPGGRGHPGRPGRRREPGVDHGRDPRARLRRTDGRGALLRGVRPAEPVQRLHGAEHVARARPAYGEGAAPPLHGHPHRGAAAAVPLREHRPAEPHLVHPPRRRPHERSDVVDQHPRAVPAATRRGAAARRRRRARQPPGARADRARRGPADRGQHRHGRRGAATAGRRPGRTAAPRPACASRRWGRR